MTIGRLSPTYRLKDILDILDTGKQGLAAKLTALANMDSTPGITEQTGADTFSKRAFGVAAGTSIPTRADADTRYAAASHNHAIADVTGLQAALDAKQSTPVASVTVGTLPSASPAGKLIYVSDEAGGAVLAFSDGAAWRRVTDRAVVS